MAFKDNVAIFTHSISNGLKSCFEKLKLRFSEELCSVKVGVAVFIVNNRVYFNRIITVFKGFLCCSGIISRIIELGHFFVPVKL